MERASGPAASEIEGKGTSPDEAPGSLRRPAAPGDAFSRLGGPRRDAPTRLRGPRWARRLRPRRAREPRRARRLPGALRARATGAGARPRGRCRGARGMRPAGARSRGDHEFPRDRRRRRWAPRASAPPPRAGERATRAGRVPGRTPARRAPSRAAAGRAARPWRPVRASLRRSENRRVEGSCSSSMDRVRAPGLVSASPRTVGAAAASPIASATPKKPRKTTSTAGRTRVPRRQE